MAYPNVFGYLNDPDCESLNGQTLEYFFQAKSGDEQARQRLIKSLMRLAYRVAYKYRSKHCKADFEDLVQTAQCAVIQAVDTWSEDKARSLQGYAYSLARRAVIETIRASNLIVIPRNVWRNLRKLIDTENLGEYHFTVDELAEMLFLSKKRILFLLAAKQVGEIELGFPALHAVKQQVESTNQFPLGNDIFPCLAEVERNIKHSIPDEARREIFCMHYGLCGEEKTGTRKLAKEMQTSEGSISYALLLAIQDLKNYYDPDYDPYYECLYCGSKFLPAQNHIGHQKYCSVKCREKYNWQKQKSEPAVKICVWCGKKFTPKRRYAKLCGESCRRKHDLERKRQRHLRLKAEKNANSNVV